MAENQDHSASQVTPTSNQNLIIGIVMGAVVLLLLFIVINQQSDSKAPEDDELAQLKQEVEDARASSRTSIGYAPGQNSEALAVKIKQDVDALNSMLSNQQANLDRLRGSEEAVRNLSRQNTDLQNQLSQSRINAQRVPGLEAQIATLRADLASAQDRLNNSVDESTVESMRSQLATARNDATALQQQINQLKAEMATMVDRNRLAVLQAQISPLEEENRKLRAELQQLRADADRAKLFVTRDKLSPRAQKLFGELVRLEGNAPAARLKAYERIGQDLNARVVESATFKTGSSALDATHEDHIKKIAATAPGNAFFLVVGYASKTGDLQQNRELSAKRSTRVASVVNYLKQQGQEVQAVYLGETDRFGAQAAPNQVCEVWEIRP
ncbi:MAG: OmpA family protein [Verrucomicrobiaceae bacterium]